MAKEMELPGFRFHPTEEELLDFYLKNMVYGKIWKVEVIGFLNIYRHDPWDLPRKYILLTGSCISLKAFSFCLGCVKL